MKISDSFKKIIVEEITFVAEKMEQSTQVPEKLFYFSGVHGVLQRVFNLEYVEELVYIHFVLTATYETFIQRLKGIQQGEGTIPLLEEQLNKLILTLKELRDNIQENKDIHETLKKFVLLSFSTTGNGYYLLQKGMLKI